LVPLALPHGHPRRSSSTVIRSIPTIRGRFKASRLLPRAARNTLGEQVWGRALAKPGAPELHWDLLELSLRRRICEEAGLPSAAAQTLAAELSATERDLNAWTYAVVAQVRIVFETTTGEDGG
jgi:hypothetical protein